MRIIPWLLPWCAIGIHESAVWPWLFCVILIHLTTNSKILHRKNMIFFQASTLSVNVAVELYGTDLECYAHKQLPRFKMPKSFHDRPDSAYLYLVRQCPYIHTLMIRERISSSSVLLLAYTGKNLRYFHVRRNAIGNRWYLVSKLQPGHNFWPFLYSA